MGARIKHVSEHFNDRWRERVGGEPPSCTQLNFILNGCKRIRKSALLYQLTGGRIYPVRVPAEYWSHERGLILLVDESRRIAITVVHHSTMGK